MNPNEAFAESRELHPNLPERVDVIDCTLRDGEQAPGVAFTVAEKVELGLALARAGLRCLDAGFPAASGADREAMQELRARAPQLSLAATARPLPGDVAAAAAARATEVFLFAPTSDFRLENTLGIDRIEFEARLLSAGEDALGRGLAVNVVFEDATRADPVWLAGLSNRLAQRLPLSRLVLADTVGRACPERTTQLFRRISRWLERDVALCSHCHNDFGLATANTLAAVAAGARAVTCTVNAIGERAGNADLAETVAGLTHLLGVDHGVDPLELGKLSSLVERISGIHMSALKPVTGYNVFRHESGVHRDAMKKDPKSYEFLPASWLGRRHEYVLGKHSGRSMIRELLARARLLATPEQEARLHRESKRLAEERNKAEHEVRYGEHLERQASLLAGLSFRRVLAETDLAPPSSTRAQRHEASPPSSRTLLSRTHH